MPSSAGEDGEPVMSVNSGRLRLSDHWRAPRAGMKKAGLYAFCLIGMALLLPSVDAAADDQHADAAWVLDFDSLDEAEASFDELRQAGDVDWEIAGPKPPRYPDAQAENRAALFGGKGSRLVVKDPGTKSFWDFDNGDRFSFEAIVRVDEIGEGQNVYLIGKGRTHAKGFSANNQNWAIRLRQLNGTSRLSFLFATPEPINGSPWHRWTSDKGFTTRRTWHHLALTYEFGEPNSLQAWLNGERVSGKWDMGGPTQNAPVVDDSEVWVGSSMGGQAASSFRGRIDRMVVSRKSLDAERIAKAWNPLPSPPPTAPKMPLNVGSIDWWWNDSVRSHTQWDEEIPEIGSTLETRGPLLIHRLPLKYDDYGIRESYDGATHLRLGLKASLPAGEHRWLVRTRGLAKLWLDDQTIATVKPQTGRTDGHNPVQPLPERPGPGMRRLAYGVQETLVEHSLPKDGQHDIILETVVGGPRYRTEPGETLVAVQFHGRGPFRLLQPDSGDSTPDSAMDWLPMTDEVIEEQTAILEADLWHHDRKNRISRAAKHNDYWQERHDMASTWIKQLPPINPPKLKVVNDGLKSPHPIDRFIAAKIQPLLERQEAGDRRSGTNAEHDKHFKQEVLPILRDRCFRCHDESDEGGLRLSSAEAIRKGGDSGEAVVTAGDPHASELMRRVRSEDESERMPPSEPLSNEEMETLDRWIADGAMWPEETSSVEIKLARLTDDASFVRRAYLDVIGVPPTESQYNAFVQDDSPNKRDRLVDDLLNHSGFADHWVSFWQDVLAENPNLLKPSLNNTGPFRFFLHESLSDHKPLDRMATELLMLRGSRYEGGSAGFGMAADNDAPEATRCIVAASAFMGMNLQCARCHDSPYHETTQQDLYSLAALLARKPLKVPASSSVPAAFFEDHPGRASLIQVTLPPGKPVAPTWPFANLVAEDRLDRWMRDPADPRERLAAAITIPENARFAEVIVNRVWQRLVGAGFVEPLGDWENSQPSHPELLQWLARDFVGGGYDFRDLIGSIMKSQTYQREAIGNNASVGPGERLFAAPDRRRLTAEQIVDSMVVGSGKPMQVEALTFDQEARRPPATMIHLAPPERAWQFTTLSNERDRPSLAFPRAGAVVTVLETFGWTGSRQSAIDRRDHDPNVLQPGAIGNSVFGSWMVAASNGSELADLAVSAKTPNGLATSLYTRFLSRSPNPDELHVIAEVLADGFEDRVVPEAHRISLDALPPLEHVSWSNHLADRANSIKLELEERAVHGDPPDVRLRSSWRQNYEDVVWSLVNSPEFVWIP